MVIYRRIEDVEPVTNTVLTIGSYDGLHRGHQEVINRTVAAAGVLGNQSALITFDPHPKRVLRSSQRFHLLMDIDKKLRLLEDLDVDIALVIPFTHEFSKMTAGEFLEDVVVPCFHPVKIVIGIDHRFGHDREGDGIFLEGYGKRGSFEVEIVDSVKDQEERLSSTHIRNLIRQGNVQKASLELGWVFGFDAVVVKGSGRGHLLNFPTTNFIAKDPAQLVPKRGVYFARGVIDDRCLHGMCNLGYRPTFGENEFSMEIHFLDDLEGDMYGKSFEVQFLERIRDEKKFDSPRELVEQLRKDRRFCLSLVGKYRQEEPCP
ncbi:MAG: bifunctional riboflavin kinase/FAD synthetase [Candidatus Neomarinimicrobiota bacterium]